MSAPELPIVAEVRAGLALAGLLGGGSRRGQAQSRREHSRGAAELGRQAVPLHHLRASQWLWTLEQPLP